MELDKDDPPRRRRAPKRAAAWTTLKGQRRGVAQRTLKVGVLHDPDQRVSGTDPMVGLGDWHGVAGSALVNPVNQVVRGTLGRYA